MKPDEVRDEFGRIGVHNDHLNELIRALSTEIVRHCVKEVPPTEGLASLCANVNSLTLQVISHLVHYVTSDQYELKQALIALDQAADANAQVG